MKGNYLCNTVLTYYITLTDNTESTTFYYRESLLCLQKKENKKFEISETNRFSKLTESYFLKFNETEDVTIYSLNDL